MKKKPSKDIIVYQQLRSKGCNICEQSQPNFLNNSKMIRKKFYIPQIQSYHFRNLNDIIFDAYSKNYLSYEQVLKDTSQQCMEQYNDWNKIVHSIKKVVLQRCQTNFYGYVDFKQQTYDISLGHYLRKKQFLKRRKITSPYKSSLSTQQTAQDKNLLECLQSKILNKHLQKIQSTKNSNKKEVKTLDCQSNVSVIQLRKLTQKLDMMVQPVLRKPRKSSKSKNNMLSPKKKIPVHNNFINLKSFKKQLQKQISVINKNQEDLVVLDKKSQNQCQKILQINNDIKQTYGLKVFKPNPNKKHQKLLSTQKISVPMTPKPRFQFSNNQYEERFVAQTPKLDTYKVSNPQSPCLYRTNCSSRNSTSSTKSLKKINSVNSKSKNKLKSSATKLKK